MSETRHTALGARRDALSPAKRMLLEQRIRGAAPEGRALRSPPRGSYDGLASFAQRQLWILSHLAGAPHAFNIPIVADLNPPVDVIVLERSLAMVVERHESLRTAFAMEGTGLNRVVSHAVHLPLEVRDLRALSSAGRERAIADAVRDHATTAFDLARAPLLRASVVLVDATIQRFLLTAHHLVLDGWSLGVLFDELNTCCSAVTRGDAPHLPDVRMHYGDYVAWQQEWLGTAEAARQERYWVAQLSGIDALDLPTDWPRSPAAPDCGAQQAMLLPTSTSDKVRGLARDESATLFMALLAAIACVLARYSGQTDIAIGAPVAARTRLELERLVGPVLNTFVIRVDCSGNPTFRDLLQRVRDTALGAFANQDLPFERVVDAVRLPREAGRPRLFEAYFNLLDVADESLAAIPFAAETHAPVDLSFYAGQRGASIPIVAIYRHDLFGHATIARMLEHVASVLDEVTANPSIRLAQLPLAADVPCPRVNLEHPFVEFSREELDQSIVSRFRHHVRQRPQSLALIAKGGPWTYAELDQRSRAVTARLRSELHAGLDRVALLLDHDAPMIAAILGTLAAGAAYVPLDSGDPDDRLAAVLDDARVELILTDHEHEERARAVALGSVPVLTIDQTELDGGNSLDHSTPGALAYLLYTSGSTGRPKGVMQSHRNVLGHIRAYTNALHIASDDRLSLVASPAVDAAVMDIFGALLNGATLCLRDLRQGGVEGLSEWLERERITIYHSTPTVYRHLMATATSTPVGPALRLVVLGGEELMRRDVNLFRDRFDARCLLINGLGPTESTVALQELMDRDTAATRSSVPVGRPVAGTDVVLVDPTGAEITGVGVGEIEIRGEHVALGYWRLPEATRAAFVPVPAGERQRRYRTGDIGRRLPDGRIEFLGRLDGQVKIRGHRVEIGEVEACLAAHVAVREVAVAAEPTSSGGLRLVAYVVPRDDADLEPSALRRAIGQRLPAYMMPSEIIMADALPRTASGKLNRPALAEVPRPPQPRALASARTPDEEVLVSIWREVLGIHQFGIQDDFFELGGHSLLATQLSSRVRDAFGVELPLRRVFETPTVAGLADAVREYRDRGDAARSPAIVAIPRVPAEGTVHHPAPARANVTSPQ